MFCFGGLCSVNLGVGYVYLMELLPKKVQTGVTSWLNVQEAFVYVFVTIYYWKISRHWFWLVFFGFAVHLLGCILLLWVPESPRYLIAAGRLEEARRAFAVVARINKKHLEWDPKRFSDNSSGAEDNAEKVLDRSGGKSRLIVGSLPPNLTEQMMREWLE